jgi:tetraacyldisaccharide 4'-kinase
MANWLQNQWERYTFWHLILLPISWIFAFLSSTRKLLYKLGYIKSYRLNVPVVVVGNINVGGTGKTPLVIWLAEQLKLAGYTPGVISRGYGGSSKRVMQVLDSSRPDEVGDEPVLIARRSGCPVFVGSNRVSAGYALLNAYPNCNIIISDDGLQHYRLQRDVEIIVFDGAKGFGNGALLPAGPLREPQARLKLVDALVSNGQVKNSGNLAGQEYSVMQLQATQFYNLVDECLKLDADAFANKKTVAVAGIGNPERFFEELRRKGLDFESFHYSDHYAFRSEDFEKISADIILMTEKDAVKCKAFAKPNFWVLPVYAMMSPDLLPIILNKLNTLGKKNGY